MTEGTALVEIDIPHELAEGSRPALFLKEARAAERFFDFFTANIRNKHTRRAYFNAACKFSEFCTERGVLAMDYLKGEGTLEHAQLMAAHSSPRTTKLYDRRNGAR